MRSVIGQAAQGRTRAVLIEGEAGIGKTRLMTEALAVAEGLGFRVLYGACDDVEQDRPLRALVEALGAGSNPPTARRPELAELFGSARMQQGGRPRSSGAVDGSWVIVESVVDVLEDLASTDPVALAIEDLQWADPLTLRVVHAVVRRMQRIPLVLLATVRPGSHGAHVDRTIADVVSHGALHVVLDSLDAGAAAELAGAVTGLPPGPGLLEQVGRAGGNPLFVIELVRALADDGALGGAGRAGRGPLGIATADVAADAAATVEPASRRRVEPAADRVGARLDVLRCRAGVARPVARRHSCCPR